MSSRTLPPLDFPPLDDYDEGWGFLDGPILDPELLHDAPFAAGGGALAAIAYGLLTRFAQYTPKDATAKVSWFAGEGTVPALKRVGGAAAVGLVGARLAWGKSRDLAKGILGAMGAQAGVELVKLLTNKDGKNLFSGGALGDGLMDALTTSSQSPYLLGDVDVTEGNLLGFDEVSVESRRPELADLSAWMS